ncbi:MAG: sugar phosphate nucleotidyltransferase, partial [Clostridia bacterium]
FGIREFVICLGYKGEMIKNYFVGYNLLHSDCTVDFSRDQLSFHSPLEEKDWKVTLADTGQNALKGARIKKIEPYLDDEVNLLTYSDGLCDVSITDLVAFHKKSKKTVTLTAVSPPGMFGEIIQKNGVVTGFREKPSRARHLINGGFMVFNKSLFPHLSREDSCDFERGVLEELARQGEVAAYEHRGNWRCMDNEADLMELNGMYRDGGAFWKNW